MSDIGWMAEGLCAEADDPDDWFPQHGGNGGLEAKTICEECPVQLRCRDYARAEGVPDGIWGGEGSRARKSWWKENGGRPSLFNDALDAWIERQWNPLLELSDPDIPDTCGRGHSLADAYIYPNPREGRKLQRECVTCRHERRAERSRLDRINQPNKKYVTKYDREAS